MIHKFDSLKDGGSRKKEWYLLSFLTFCKFYPAMTAIEMFMMKIHR